MHISIHMYIYIMIEPVDIYTTTAVPLSTGNDNAIVKKIIHPKLSVAGCHNKTRPTRAQHGRVTSFLPVIHAACGNRDAFTNRYVGEKLHEKRETLDSSSLSFSGEFCCRSMSPKRHRPVLLHFSNVLPNWPATKYLPWGRAPVVKKWL